ncbi:MAG: DEAD/DEAH box helicase family protein [Chloroflexota bacterium]|nr:DEAD/DEAH box helicase family protein [Chloroflexota bacterium]
MSRSVRLRAWQHAALGKFLDSHSADFLAVATPGAGKTTFALVALRMLLAEGVRRVIVVTPTAHPKTQWAQAAARLQLHLDPAWSSADASLATDMHGVVTTYQQVAINPTAVRRLAQGALVVLDEVHHGGQDRAWGEALRHAFAGAGCACRAHPSAATSVRSRSFGTRRTKPCLTLSTAMATRCATAASCGQSISRRSVARWSGAHPTARCTPRRSTIR